MGSCPDVGAGDDSTCRLSCSLRGHLSVSHLRYEVVQPIISHRLEKDKPSLHFNLDGGCL